MNTNHSSFNIIKIFNGFCWLISKASLVYVPALSKTYLLIFRILLLLLVELSNLHCRFVCKLVLWSLKIMNAYSLWNLNRQSLT